MWALLKLPAISDCCLDGSNLVEAMWTDVEIKIILSNLITSTPEPSVKRAKIFKAQAERG